MKLHNKGEEKNYVKRDVKLFKITEEMSRLIFSIPKILIGKYIINYEKKIIYWVTSTSYIAEKHNGEVKSDDLSNVVYKCNIMKIGSHSSINSIGIVELTLKQISQMRIIYEEMTGKVLGNMLNGEMFCSSCGRYVDLWEGVEANFNSRCCSSPIVYGGMGEYVISEQGKSNLSKIIKSQEER